MHSSQYNNKTDHKHTSYQVPAATCFGTKQVTPDIKCVL